MVDLSSAAETWVALTLVVLLGLYAWRRLAQRGTDEPAWSEAAAGVTLFLALGYVAGTAWSGLPTALLVATLDLPSGVSVLVAGLPALVGLFGCYWVPAYVAQAHAARPDALAHANALRAAHSAGRGVLVRFGWIVVGAAAVAQFGALLGAVVGAACYVLLREAYDYRVTLSSWGTIRPATSREVERVRELFGDAVASSAPVRILEPDDPDAHDVAELPAVLAGVPGRRRVVIHEGLLDPDSEPARAARVLARHQFVARTFDAILLARAGRLAVLFAAAGLVLPVAAPTPPLPVRLLALLVVAPAAAAALERVARDRLLAGDRRAAEEVGRDAVGALLADYDGPPGDDRLREFLMLHPSATRRLDALGLEPDASAERTSGADAAEAAAEADEPADSATGPAGDATEPAADDGAEPSGDGAGPSGGGAEPAAGARSEPDTER